MANAQEYRDQSLEELRAALLDLRKERFDMVNEQQQTKKLEHPHKLKQNKRNIARILTVIREKEHVNKEESK